VDLYPNPDAAWHSSCHDVRNNLSWAATAGAFFSRMTNGLIEGGTLEISSWMQLKSPYASYLEQGSRENFVSALCREGLAWWFNMEIPCLVAHLAALESLPQNTPTPSRLLFLMEAAKVFMSPENLDHSFETFLQEDDLEAACAAAGAGVASVWDSGTDFERQETWYSRIVRLLEKADRLSPLAKSSLLGFKGFVEITYQGDLAGAMETLRSQQRWAEKAGSTSLRVFHAAVLGHCAIFAGDLPRAEVILFEASPLCGLPETSYICNVYFQITLGLFQIVQGNAAEAGRILQEITRHPFFDILPPSIWLFGNSELLLAHSFLGDMEAVAALSGRIQERTIREQNHFHNGYAHFNRGIASLLSGKPYKALIHGNEAMESAQRSKSPIPEQMAAFLIGVALSDLGRRDEAMEHFSTWVSQWEKNGFYLFAFAGAIEIANLHLKEGRQEEARKSYGKAVSFLPPGEEAPVVGRPAGFLENLKRSLYSDLSGAETWEDMENAAIRIETFGELVIRIGDRTIYDGKWPGARTKNLLKALIVCGGTSVSSDFLVDTLWPEADGDMAMRNLKVTLSRLRRVGCRKGEEPLPWIKVRARHVSLVNSLCVVDSIRFRRKLGAALKEEKNIDLLLQALDLYKDDFLGHERNEAWIIRHRELLREEFMKGVISLSNACLKAGKPEVAVPYLQKAFDADPLNGEVSANLMRCHLEMGSRSGALKVFNKAKQILMRELGIKPGPTLITLAREAGLRDL
jgi:DNA-binding SARP family transcriptional activator